MGLSNGLDLRSEGEGQTSLIALPRIDEEN